MGISLTEAMEEALDAADSVKGRDIKYDKGDLEKLTEAIATGNKLGLNWGGGSHASRTESSSIQR